MSGVPEEEAQSRADELDAIRATLTPEMQLTMLAMKTEMLQTVIELVNCWITYGIWELETDSLALDVMSSIEFVCFPRRENCLESDSLALDVMSSIEFVCFPRRANCLRIFA
jgi:hypothetical protein